MIVMLGAPKRKTRSRTTKIKSGSTNRRYNAAGVLQTTNNLADYTWESGTDEIVYTTQPKSNRSRSNMCRHTQEYFTYGGDPESYYTAMEKPPVGIAGYYWLYQGHHKIACDSKDSVVGAAKTALGSFSPGPSYLAANGLGFINSAWQDLQPDLTELSIPNFLIEIDQIQDLFKLWKKNVSLVKNVAGLHLNYKFGWKPTVGDLGNVVDALTSFRLKLKAFEDSLGTFVQKSKKLVSESSSVTGTVVSGGSTAYYSATKRRTVEAFITYAPQPLAVMSGSDKVLRAIIDSLGVELNPRIIWDALPFTFVVDWFFGVGSWLSRFKIDALELPVSLVDSCLQVKDELSVDWYWRRFPSDGLFYNPPTSGGCFYTLKYFQRMPIFPDFASLSGLGWKTPSFNQATLLVSLATVLKGR